MSNPNLEAMARANWGKICRYFGPGVLGLCREPHELCDAMYESEVESIAGLLEQAHREGAAEAEAEVKDLKAKMDRCDLEDYLYQKRLRRRVRKAEHEIVLLRQSLVASNKGVTTRDDSLRAMEALASAEAKRGDRLKADLDAAVKHDHEVHLAFNAERERSERLQAEVQALREALGYAHDDLCRLEPLLTAKRQAQHIISAISWCKYLKQPEWNERLAARAALAQKARP